MKFTRRLEFFKHMAEAQRYSLCRSMSLQVRRARPAPAPHQPSRVVKRCHLFELASGGGGPSSGWGMFHDLEGHQGIGPTVVLPPIRACRLVLLTICHLALPPPAPPAHLEWNNSSPIQRSSGERSDVTARRTRVVIARAHVRGRAIMTGLERLCFTM